MIGLYVLANDIVYDQVIAFINSYHRFNSNTIINITIIPYNDDCKRLNILVQENPLIKWFTDTTLLEQCDYISKQFTGNVDGKFRKMVCWEGEYDQFIYIDIDTIIQQNFKSLNISSLLNRYDYIANFCDMPYLMDNVWRSEHIDLSLFTLQQYELSVDLSFIISKKGFISLDMCRSLLPVIIKFKYIMNMSNPHIPFFNFLLCIRNHRITSLNHLNDSVPMEFYYLKNNAIVNEDRLDTTDCFMGDRFNLYIRWSSSQLLTSDQRIPYYSLWEYYYNGGKSLLSITV